MEVQRFYFLLSQIPTYLVLLFVSQMRNTQLLDYHQNKLKTWNLKIILLYVLFFITILLFALINFIQVLVNQSLTAALSNNYYYLFYFILFYPSLPLLHRDLSKFDENPKQRKIRLPPNNNLYGP